MINSYIILFVISLTFSALSACHRGANSSRTDASKPLNVRVAPMAPVTAQDLSRKENKPAITISSPAVYGWWWSDDQLESNFDADNPPQKKSYLKLDKWDASQPDSPHPDRIDIICHLENNTNEPIDITLEAFADFKIASYKVIATESGTQETVDEKLKQTQWTGDRKLGKVDISRLSAGEVREVQFKDFSLRTVVNKYLKPAAGDLWPWKLRIIIVATTSKGLRVGSLETTMNLIPAD